MADDADIANDIAAAFIAEAEQRARGKSAPQMHPGFDGLHCVECEVEIPAGRLVLQRVRCVDCQTVVELQWKMGPR